MIYFVLSKVFELNILMKQTFIKLTMCVSVGGTKTEFQNISSFLGLICI